MSKSIQRYSLIAGLGACALGVWLLWNLPSAEERPAPMERMAEVMDLPERPNLSFGLPSESPHTAENGQEALGGLPDGAIPGQRVWQTSDLAAAIAAAEAAGLEVLGTIPELGLLLVSGDEATLTRLGADQEEDFLYPVGIPRLPDDSQYERLGLQAFESNALAYLGVETVAAHWGDGVRIAVLDTGIGEHSVFSQSRIERLTGPTGLREDDHGHGTAIGGLIVGKDEFAQGLVPGATLLSIPVLDAEGSGNTFSLASGIIQAVESGARIINISAGSLQSSRSLEAAVRYANQRGVVIVAAAGNDGHSMARFPAAYAGVIGVSTVDAQGQIPGFNNSGQGVDISAPGLGVYTTWVDDDFVSFSGSSAATPFVASAIALLMSEQPQLTAQQAADLVLNYTNEAGLPGPDALYGAGILNIERLLWRDTPGVVNLAVVPPFVDISSFEGSTLPVHVALQNRGTTDLSQTSMQILVDGVAYQHTVGNLAPGQSGGVTLPLPLHLLQSETGTRIEVTGFHRESGAAGDRESSKLEATLRIAPPGD